MAYGSEKDSSAAPSSSVIVADDRRLKEIVITHSTSKFQTLSEVLIYFYAFMIGLLLFCARFV